MTRCPAPFSPYSGGTSFRASASSRAAVPRPVWRHPARRRPAAGWLIWIVQILLAGSAIADAPRSAMKEGLRAYDDGQFQEAAEAFHRAAEQAGDTRLNPARALYNRANALYQQDRFEEAAQAYQEALRSTDLELQQSSHYNRGNAFLSQAYAQAEAQQLDTAKGLTERALDSYRNALTLNPDDRDAKINHELADRFREELEMLLAQQPPQPQPEQGEDEQEEQQDEAQDSEAQPGEQPQPDEPQDEGAEAAPRPEEGESPPAEAAPQDRPPDTMEEMTEEEAMLLLDAMRDEEQETRDQMRLRLGEPAEVDKDW